MLPPVHQCPRNDIRRQGRRCGFLMATKKSLLSLAPVMAQVDGMPRLELISLHLASGAGCSARPLLMVTPEDFLSPPVCIGSPGRLCVPGVSPAQIETHVVQPKMSEIP